MSGLGLINTTVFLAKQPMLIWSKLAPVASCTRFCISVLLPATLNALAILVDKYYEIPLIFSFSSNVDEDLKSLEEAKKNISFSSSVDVKPTKYMCCRSVRRKLFWKIGEVTYGGQILVTRIPSISLKRRRSTSKQVSLNVAKMCTIEVPCIWEPLQGSSFKELNRNPILKMRQGIFRRDEEGSFLQCLLSNTLLQISCT